MPFKRENRYSVIKWKDAEKYLSPDDLETLALIGASIAASRLADEKPELECVVVEQDWPEYESTWQAIEQRMHPMSAEYISKSYEIIKKPTLENSIDCLTVYAYEFGEDGKQELLNRAKLLNWEGQGFHLRETISITLDTVI